MFTTNDFTMKTKIVFSLSIFLLITSISFAQKNIPAKKTDYFPPASEWETRSLFSMNIDSLKLQQAISFAIEKDNKAPRNMEIMQTQSFGKEPFGEGIGPFSERGDPTGLIVYKGYIIAQWGDPYSVEMTHSVTKSFLSTVVGLAFDKGLIKDVNDKVRNYIAPIEVYDPLQNNRPAELMGQEMMIKLFETAHNKTITWDHLLRQTSDWEGTLWGKPEWADRPSAKPDEWTSRKRVEAGTVFEYNDVRVNVLALAATNIFRKPLPEILKTNIMDPIGASSTWRWNGYRNSWIVLDGLAVQSVSGGGHWGGGLFINAFDMARFGLLTLHRGNWNGKQLLSEKWVSQSLTPTVANTGYGYMNWYLNTDNKLLPAAPSNAFVHLGNGTNMIYVDPKNELVMVVRWIENNAMNEMVKKVLEAVER